MIPFSKQDKYRAFYNISGKVGWIRIAKIDIGISDIYVTFNGRGMANLQLLVSSNNGFENVIEKKYYRYSNGINRFSKARIVSKGNSGSYLEIYNTVEITTVTKELYVTTANIQGVTLMNEETRVDEEIQDGYSKIEIEL